MFLPIGRPCFFAHRQAGQPALRLAGLSAYGQKNRMAGFKASRACWPIGKNTRDRNPLHRKAPHFPARYRFFHPISVPRFFQPKTDAVSPEDGMFLPIGRPDSRP
jgi:hypothetical protein